jgi:hypothetical protein
MTELDELRSSSGYSHRVACSFFETRLWERKKDELRGRPIERIVASTFLLVLALHPKDHQVNASKPECNGGRKQLTRTKP